ncbi:molybdopterin-guanine dinucleotide biosynthesis protein B [Rubrivirga sp. S365]|uniref:Probable molybdenum cofactor guanylyltransferase n=1 Tax=Rubrivirga litoralis TaxID=3075598 RepID=A0ABU3BQJ5_9BACT|nr:MULTISPECIES: molybdopterin-guanine dinucleotide biosynthesis protein B [unclassified Rubrivirga]MDT0631562.1 molybdopterin-guanine dinucleotide biosynthesis protein B [Rubrivirga sp. F394]MDT7857197.1 molybdopterin-guanine dinucleotide biosynthesis protein B [Rubrivirga sp. S365]
MRHGQRPRFTFHPFEVALCGYSGSGKTTLACRLLERWRDRYRVGFVKHDVHRFAIDTPGKDTRRATEAGAAGVMINDPHHFARISTLPYSAVERASAFIDADFVVAEGFKRSDLPKLLVLDADGRAEREHRDGVFSNVLAVVGPDSAPPGLGVPFLHRDDVDGVADLVEGHVRGRAESPLYGLVLVGGQSRRMGRPKWAIEYQGEPQAARTARLLGDVCERVFLSVRPGQTTEALGLPTLPDQFPSWGPAAGILTAMEAEPGAAWLVAACDLPFLDAPTLAALATGRDRLRIATAYRSAHDGLPEPLCTVWEPRARQRLLQAASIGIACPRRVLRESRPCLLDLDDSRALDNANTPADFEAARSALTDP